MTAIPDDIMKAANRAYETLLNDDGASLVSVVNRSAEDYVKIAIARALMAERERAAKMAETMKVYEIGDRFMLAAAIRKGSPIVMPSSASSSSENRPSVQERDRPSNS